MKQTIYTLLVFMGCLSAAHAQKSAYELTPGYWTLGLNAGLSYQSSDVSSVLEGYGGGLTLAKNLYYQPNAPLAFDVQGRFLYSQSYGLNGVPSFDLENNEALNGTRNLDYINYPSELGVNKPFIFQNYKTDMAELALEGVLTFSQLRERNIHLALFGGIGLDWYKTRIDQAGADGQEYYEDYINVYPKVNQSATLRDLRNFLDGEYETLADDFGSGGKIGLMPAVGLELGYYFSPNFYASLGHKVTFSRTDLLDGEQWADSNNDIHHYTSLGLNWIIELTKKQNSLAPHITVIQPSTSTFIAREPSTLVRAEIRNINSSADVECTVNGQNRNFSYANGNFSCDVPLQPGRNEVIIAASNPSGRAQKQVVIYYEVQLTTKPPVVKPPVVTPPNAVPAPEVRITSPAYNTLETEANDFTVRATVRNVTTSDIRFTVNGRAQRDFYFNDRTGEFSATIPLADGSNSIELEAFNNAGRQRDEATIIRGQERIPYPSISITQPSSSRTETDYRTVTVRARTEHIFEKNDITFSVNGRRSYNFYFDERRQEVEATVNLQEGYNTIILAAQNESGKTQDEVTIRYEQARPSIPLPVVRITQPNNSITTTNSTEIVRASIQYVQRKEGIELTVNGQQIYNFNFSNGLLTDNVRLHPGNNTIVIRAYNERGQDEARVNIRYQEVVVTPQPPRISFSEPANNSRVRNPSVNVRATVTNVNTPSSIRLTVNGRTLSKYSFERNQLSATADLQEGQNTIVLRASNNDGEDEARVTVYYDKPQPKTPPVVRITAPGSNFRTTEPTIEMRASVSNISSKSGIQVLVNDRAIAFNFSEGTVSATANLQEGNNSVTIKAKNNDGSDEASVNVLYRKAEPKKPKPTVQFVYPNRSGTTVNGPKINLRATVKNVDSKSGIRLTVNGKSQSDYTFDSKSGNLSAVVELETGNNEIAITGQNESGEATEKTIVSYQTIRKQQTPTAKKVAAPTVTIQSASQPVINPLHPNVGTSRVVAIIENVTDLKQIVFSNNGKTITDFSFDERNKKFEATVLLEKGKNLLIISAKNEAGEATDQTTVSF